MESHKHIVTRIPKTPERRAEELPEKDVEILDAWLWPAADLAEQEKEAAAIEVSLLPPTRRLLRDFPIPGLERPYLRHLEQRIVRNPRDLLSHVRRLYLANALDDVATITGALTDLFLVLGKHGRLLRRRLLKLVKPQLTAKQRHFFAAHLEHGLEGTEVIPEIPRSRLSKHVLGTTRIVCRSDDDALNSDDPVRLARDSIARGHYDVAQAVLEGAIEADPGNADVSAALVELYDGGNLRSSFDKTYTALLGRQLACRDRWDELARRFRSRVGADG